MQKGAGVSILFFSYSHADERLRDQLETHLSGLRRQGIISSWHDRRIIAGTELDKTIDNHIDTADLILLLISPDFIASDYCYEKEMNRALERHHTGQARVIPVILRPCDWHSLPFGALLATPRDSRPITMWPNIDEAFLDVVTAIKNALKELGQKTGPIPAWATQAVTWSADNSFRETVRSSNLRLKKTFTDLDRDRFKHEGFEYLANFFENSLKELVNRNPDLDQTFRRIDANQFIVAAYRGGEKVCKGSASIGGGMTGGDCIEYSMTDDPRYGGMNEAVYVKNDDQTLYFDLLGMQSYAQRREKLTFEGAAELFWDLFIQPLQS
jgi:TIR domain